MDRTAAGIVLAIILGLSAALPRASAGAEPAPAKRPAAGSTAEHRRLGEVTILGTPEHPGVIFFLPKARLRLLPPRYAEDWRKRVLRQEAVKGDLR